MSSNGNEQCKCAWVKIVGKHRKNRCTARRLNKAYKDPVGTGVDLLDALQKEKDAREAENGPIKGKQGPEGADEGERLTPEPDEDASSGNPEVASDSQKAEAGDADAETRTAQAESGNAQVYPDNTRATGGPAETEDDQADALEDLMAGLDMPVDGVAGEAFDEEDEDDDGNDAVADDDEDLSEDELSALTFTTGDPSVFWAVSAAAMSATGLVPNAVEVVEG